LDEHSRTVERHHGPARPGVRFDISGGVARQHYKANSSVFTEDRRPVPPRAARAHDDLVAQQRLAVDVNVETEVEVARRLEMTAEHEFFGPTQRRALTYANGCSLREIAPRRRKEGLQVPIEETARFDEDIYGKGGPR
jgi:hypothetical protein